MELTPEERKRAIDWMYTNCKKNFGLDLSDLYQAIRESKGYTTPYMKIENWKCDICNLSFSYHQYPTDEDMLNRGIFDRCPRCGLQVYVTKQAEYETKRTGKIPEWYEKYVEQHITFWETTLGGKWFYNKKDELAAMERLKKQSLEIQSGHLREIIQRKQLLQERVSKIIHDSVLKKELEDSKPIGEKKII